MFQLRRNTNIPWCALLVNITLITFGSKILFQVNLYMCFPMQLLHSLIEWILACPFLRCSCLFPVSYNFPLSTSILWQKHLLFSFFSLCKETYKGMFWQFNASNFFFVSEALILASNNIQPIQIFFLFNISNTKQNKILFRVEYE